MEFLILVECMELNRKTTDKEEMLLQLLVDKASIDFPIDWKVGLLVRSMSDGEMGSLYLFPNGEIKESRKFGEQVSDFQFKDKDGVEVIASLYVDENNKLFELDMWKTDFNKLIDLPDLSPGSL